MKTTVKKDLQTKTLEELKKLVHDAQNALRELKLDHQQNKLQNTSSLSLKRKELAVLKTLITMRQKSEAKAKTEEPVTKRVTEKKIKEKEVKARV